MGSVEHFPKQFNWPAIAGWEVSMAVNLKPRRITENVTHWHPHPDEGLGFFLAFKFGKDIFIGADEAPFVFLNAGQRPPNGERIERYEKTRLVIGTCLGRYDEHALNEDVRKRYAASTLVARDLNLTENPALKPILEYTVFNDRLAHRGAWDIASLMFSMNTSLPSPHHGHRTLQLAYEWYEVAYEYFSLRIEQGEETPARPRGELSLNEYIIAWLINEYADEGTLESSSGMDARQVAEQLGVASRRELKRILELTERNHDDGSATDFDIFTFVEMAVAIGRSTDWIFNRVARMFSARRDEELLFGKALEELPSTVRFVQVWRNPANPNVPLVITSTFKDRASVEQTWRDKRHKLLHTIGIVTSDSPVAHKAFRYKSRMDVMVIRKSSGYTAVNIGRLPRGPFAFRLRKAESHRRMDQEELLRDGNTYTDGKQDPWCNFKEGGWMLNGAFTALDQHELPPTRLSVEKIIKELLNALTYIDEQVSRRPRKKNKKSQPPKHRFTNSPRIRT